MFTEDLSVFFNTAEFATACTIGGVQVEALFDEAYALGSVGVHGMAAAVPTLTLPTAKVPANPEGADVVLQGRAFTVAEHQPDGSGISRLFLERA